MPSVPSISLAICAKNEAETIAAVIDSALPLLRLNPLSEIIVSVDDKTTDSTEEIARRYTDKVFSHTWSNDFSAMRNGLIRRCTAEWILNLDGHEILGPGTAQVIADYLANTPPEIKGYGICLNIRPDESGIPAEWNYQIKLFKNAPEIYFEDRIHNRLVGVSSAEGNLLAISGDEAMIIHKRPVGLEEARAEQRNDMLPKEMRRRIREKPDDTRALWYLMKHWIGRANKRDRDKEWKVFLWNLWRAIAYAKRHLKYATWDNERSTTCYDLGCTYHHIAQVYGKKLGEKAKEKTEAYERKALEYLHRGVRERYDRRENYIALGQLHLERQDYHAAEHWFRLAAFAPKPYITGSIHPGPAYSWLPWSCLANVYSQMGDVKRALEAGERALELKPRDEELRRAVEITRERYYRKEDIPPSWDRRPRLYVIDKLGQFTRDLLDRWARQYQVQVSQQAEIPKLRWADIVWCEWADENAINISQAAGLRAIRIVRLHGYETLEADFAGRVLWENIDALVCPAQSVLDTAHRRFGIYQRVACHVVKNGIDLGRFQYGERNHGKQIAFVGFFNEKKNLPLLMQCAVALPEFEFHLSGRWQNIRLKEYMREHEGKLPNLHFAGWHTDVDGFLEDKNYLISTSLYEGPGVNILEAMAKGIKPLIHRWVGAEECYPGFEELLWFQPAYLAATLRAGAEYDSARYRAFVAENHDVEKQYVEIEQIIARCAMRRALKGAA